MSAVTRRSAGDLAAEANARLAAFDLGRRRAGHQRDRRHRPHQPRPRARGRRAAIRAATGAATDYLLLELDRATGKRGARARVAEDHLVALTGAEDALVTNNNAAAVALAVGLAGRGGGVVVSRGELVEIGGGVRIPEIVRRAGARLIEVGTTNRTRPSDFEDALVDGRARVVLRVHPSNFTMTGFTEIAGSGGGRRDRPSPRRDRHRRPREWRAARHGGVRAGPRADAGRAARGRRRPRDVQRRQARRRTAGGVHRRSGRPRRPDPARSAGPGHAPGQGHDGRGDAPTLGLYRAGRATTRDPGLADARDAGGRPARHGPMARRRVDRSTGRDASSTLRSTVGGGSLPGETAAVGRRRAGGVGRRRGCSRRSASGDPIVIGRIEADRVVLDLRTVDPDRGRRRSAAAVEPGARRRAMTVVVGTAGHIDHGKTTLLRALTGIDADRLPEERRRGMTIDVGYAHLTLDDGTVVDFVDVPGHDRLVGNMLVGAGEIDASLLVVAADDGPRAQTARAPRAAAGARACRPGVVVVTKVDAVEPERVDEVVAAGRASSSEPVSRSSRVAATTGAGLDGVRAALAAMVGGVPCGSRRGRRRWPSTGSFAVKGRGVVVTGSLRGGPTRGRRSTAARAGWARPSASARSRSTARRVDRGRRRRANGAQPRRRRAGGPPPWRRADRRPGRRGHGPACSSRSGPASRRTDRAGGCISGRPRSTPIVGRSGRDALPRRRDRPARGTDRRPGWRPVRAPAVRSTHPIGGRSLDPMPPRGLSRRRQTAERVAALARRRRTTPGWTSTARSSTANAVAVGGGLSRRGAAEAAIAAVEAGRRHDHRCGPRRGGSRGSGAA